MAAFGNESGRANLRLQVSVVDTQLIHSHGGIRCIHLIYDHAQNMRPSSILHVYHALS